MRLSAGFKDSDRDAPSLKRRGVFLLHEKNERMEVPRDLTKQPVYQAPRIYVILFYACLSAWTIVSVLLLGSKYAQHGRADLTQVLMIGFIFAVTWYFSLGIFYRIRIEENGDIELTSFRRTIQTQPQKIELVEGPLFPIGFVRFRIEREKVYLFCMAKDENLHRVLSLIRTRNPDIKFKSL